MEKSVPARLQIPSIGVDSTLMGLGLQADRSLQVPPTGFPAGWYTGAPTPGELGPAILAGHVDWAGHPGVFYELRNLEPGAEVTVTRLDGSAAVFRVRQVEQYPKDAFPTEAVYGNLTDAGRPRPSDHAPPGSPECGGRGSDEPIAVMATGETGFDDVTFDLVSVQYHALKAGHDYGQYVRDADNAGQGEFAGFFRQVMSQDAEQAQQCHRFTVQLTSGSPSS